MATGANVEVRSAQPGDWPRMFAINVAAGKVAWADFLPVAYLETREPPSRWQAAIGDPEHCVLVVEAQGSVGGFAHLRASGDPDASPETGELDSYYVHPDSWGKGLGRTLLAAAIAKLADMGFTEATLWTAELNHRPRRTYESAGWRLDGARRERSLGGRQFVELRYRITLPPPNSLRRKPQDSDPNS